MADAETQGTIYTEFIASQLRMESGRRTSLDDRGAKLQQAASVTVGLVVAALGALLGKETAFSGVSLWLFIGTMAFLVASFLAGVLTTRLFPYEVANADTLEMMIGQDHWGDSRVTSMSNTSYLNVQTLRNLRPGNDFKAAALQWGIALQGLGVLLGIATFGVVAASRIMAG